MSRDTRTRRRQGIIESFSHLSVFAQVELQQRQHSRVSSEVDKHRSTGLWPQREPFGSWQRGYIQLNPREAIIWSVGVVLIASVVQSDRSSRSIGDGKLPVIVICIHFFLFIVFIFFIIRIQLSGTSNRRRFNRVINRWPQAFPVPGLEPAICSERE